MKSDNKVFNAHLLTRLISALALLPVVLGAVGFGGLYFTLLLLLAGGFMIYEWYDMVKVCPSKFSLLIWLLTGVIYISLPLWSFYWLRLQTDGGWLVFWVFLMVWAMDVGGFFVGKSVGGPKMAPKISPNKTWSGLAGGMLLAIVANALFLYTFGLFSDVEPLSFNPTWVLAGGLALIAQVGDLIESQFKRHFHIKDTSGFIPGHGGLLDRADGLLLAGPAVVFLIYKSMI